MDTFWFYVKFGFDHISDLAGYDHILFLVVLCAVYRIHPVQVNNVNLGWAVVLTVDNALKLLKYA